MAVNKVVYFGTTLIDLSGDTVTADKLVAGATAHNSAGNLITGTAVTVADDFEGKISTFKEVSQSFGSNGSSITLTDADGNTLKTVINSNGSITETYTPKSGTVLTRTTTTTIGTNGVVTEAYTYSSGSNKTRTTTLTSSGATVSYT